jgi:Fe-S oxidoreductase
MRSSKILISQALNTILNNLHRTGDPLGIKKVYWTQWIDGFSMPRQGETLLYTARMYQMLPFVAQATKITEKAQPFLPMLSVKALAKVAEFANTVVTEPLLRIQARHDHRIRKRSEAVLAGIVSGLANVKMYPGYLYEKEPYSGVLLHDLELEEHIPTIAQSNYKTLKAAKAKNIITVDPHTTFMLRDIYPHYIPDYDLNVRHYLEILSESQALTPNHRPPELPKKLVIHDSCVMTRNLGIIQSLRSVLQTLGIEIIEPENTGINTACCGGPVEYAYADLSRSISGMRAKELAQTCSDVLVTCPICLINLMRHEDALGLRIWDIGELLNLTLNSPKTHP